MLQPFVVFKQAVLREGDLSWPVNGTDFIAVGIVEIGASLAKSRRVFAGRPSIRDPCRMETFPLLRGDHVEPDRAAVSVGRGLAVDRSRNREESGWACVDIAVLVREAWIDPQRSEYSIVEPSRNLEVVHT